MNICKQTVVSVVWGVFGLAVAGERETFRHWHVSVGGAFNGAVRSSLHLHNTPVPAGYAIPPGLTERDAAQAALDRKYGDGFIAEDDQTHFSGTTENWKLPVEAYDEAAGVFRLRNPYEFTAAPPTVSQAVGNRSSDDCQYGVSVELSRELWVHDEREDHRWGIDFAAAFSYFFQRNVYRTYGTETRVDHIGDGAYETFVEARDTMYSYIEETDPDYRNYPEGGMYGKGTAVACGDPGLIMDYVGTPAAALPTFRDLATSCRFGAAGDYRELEMLFLLRPWYEITDWWRVFAEAGVGVSWGRFECSFFSRGLFAEEDFAQWDSYGVAGLGTVFRYGRWDLGIDFLGRFLRDDLAVDGRFASGRIERADWGFRLMVGFEF